MKKLFLLIPIVAVVLAAVSQQNPQMLPVWVFQMGNDTNSEFVITRASDQQKLFKVAPTGTVSALAGYYVWTNRGLTTNVTFIVGGKTNQLQFIGGILTGVTVPAAAREPESKTKDF